MEVKNLSSYQLHDVLMFVLGLWMGRLTYSIALSFESQTSFDLSSVCFSQRAQTFNSLSVFGCCPQTKRFGFHENKIVWISMLVESINAITFLVLQRHTGFGLMGFLHMIIVFYLCVLTWADIIYKLLPNKILILQLGLAIILKLIDFYRYKNLRLLVSGAIGSIISFGFLYASAIIKPGAIGWGDVKLAGVMGFYLGYPAAVTALGLGLFTAAIFCAVSALLGYLKMSDTVPLGAFLSLGTVCTIVLRYFNENLWVKL